MTLLTCFGLVTSAGRDRRARSTARTGGSRNCVTTQLKTRTAATANPSAPRGARPSGMRPSSAQRQ